MVKFTRKWSNQKENLTNFRSNSTIFDLNQKLDSNSDRDFELSRRFRWISATNSDRKCRLKSHSNTIQIKFLADLDLIALAYCNPSYLRITLFNAVFPNLLEGREHQAKNGLENTSGNPTKFLCIKSKLFGSINGHRSSGWEPLPYCLTPS